MRFVRVICLCDHRIFNRRRYRTGFVGIIATAVGTVPVFDIAVLGAGRGFGGCVDPAAVAEFRSDRSCAVYLHGARFVRIAVTAILAVPVFDIAVFGTGRGDRRVMHEEYVSRFFDHGTAEIDRRGAPLVGIILLAVGAVPVLGIAAVYAGRFICRIMEFVFVADLFYGQRFFGDLGRARLVGIISSAVGAVPEFDLAVCRTGRGDGGEAVYDHVIVGVKIAVFDAADGTDRLHGAGRRSAVRFGRRRDAVFGAIRIEAAAVMMSIGSKIGIEVQDLPAFGADEFRRDAELGFIFIISGDRRYFRRPADEGEFYVSVRRFQRRFAVVDRRRIVCDETALQDGIVTVKEGHRIFDRFPLSVQIYVGNRRRNHPFIFISASGAVLFRVPAGKIISGPCEGVGIDRRLNVPFDELRIHFTASVVRIECNGVFFARAVGVYAVCVEIAAVSDRDLYRIV